MQTRILLVAATIFALVSACSSADVAGDSPASELDLRADGIGPFLVGQPADEVIAGVSAEIGGSDGDSNDSDTPLRVPDCGSPGTRVVSWGNLVLFFVERTDASVFATWSYGFDPITGNAQDIRGLGLATPAGIGLGSTRADLAAAYGPVVEFSPDVGLDLETFTIGAPADEYLSGRLTSLEPDATVQFLERQPACVEIVE